EIGKAQRIAVEEDRRIVADQVPVVLPWRNNDQDVRGTPLWLPKRRTDLCPVAALEQWLAASAITEGPLFWRIWGSRRGGARRTQEEKPIANRYQISTNPIDNPFNCADRQNWTGLAGFDAAAFAGYSLKGEAIS